MDLQLRGRPHLRPRRPERAAGADVARFFPSSIRPRTATWVWPLLSIAAGDAALVAAAAAAPSGQDGRRRGLAGSAGVALLLGGGGAPAARRRPACRPRGGGAGGPAGDEERRAPPPRPLGDRADPLPRRLGAAGGRAARGAGGARRPAAARHPGRGVHPQPAGALHRRRLGGDRLLASWTPGAPAGVGDGRARPVRLAGRRCRSPRPARPGSAGGSERGDPRPHGARPGVERAERAAADRRRRPHPRQSPWLLPAWRRSAREGWRSRSWWSIRESRRSRSPPAWRTASSARAATSASRRGRTWASPPPGGWDRDGQRRRRRRARLGGGAGRGPGGDPEPRRPRGSTSTRRAARTSTAAASPGTAGGRRCRSGTAGSAPPSERRAREVFGVSATAALYRARGARGGRRRGQLFDPRLVSYYEDVDLAGRLRAAGYRALWVPEARARHAGSITGRTPEPRAVAADLRQPLPRRRPPPGPRFPRRAAEDGAARSDRSRQGDPAARSPAGRRDRHRLGPSRPPEVPIRSSGRAGAARDFHLGLMHRMWPPGFFFFPGGWPAPTVPSTRGKRLWASLAGARRRAYVPAS